MREVDAAVAGETWSKKLTDGTGETEKQNKAQNKQT